MDNLFLRKENKKQTNFEKYSDSQIEKKKNY